MKLLNVALLSMLVFTGGVVADSYNDKTKALQETYKLCEKDAEIRGITYENCATEYIKAKIEYERKLYSEIVRQAELAKQAEMRLKLNMLAEPIDSL